MSFDKDNLFEQAVVNFKDIKAKKAENSVEPEEVPSTESAVVNIDAPKLSKDERRKIMATKMDSAKLYGNRELKQFKEAVEEFNNKIKDMALFGDLSEVVTQIFLREILESYTEPVFKGQCPYGIPEGMFKKLRADMFKSLIKQYVDGEEKK